MTDSWKTWLWRTVVTAAIIIVIAACFYAEENSRGAGAWEKARREIAARGESLKWDDYIPAPVPDDQNFYQAPMMSDWFIKGSNSLAGNPAYSLPTSNPETTDKFITENSASNYIAWSAAFEPGFGLMREAVKRPFARMNGDYTQPFRQPIPNFVSLRVVTQTLAHRAKCYLLLGEPAKALADLSLLHDLGMTLIKTNSASWLVTAMVHTAIAGLYADAVASGIESRSWLEPELAVLQKQLAEINLLPELAGAFRAERAGACYTLDFMSPEELMRLISDSKWQVSDFGWWFIPGGWIQQNKAIIASIESKMIACMDLTNRTVSPAMAITTSDQLNQIFRHVTPWNFIAAMCTPNFSKAAETMARNQTWADQAQIVCALERYRLANGKYPATLAALMPQFISAIPNDIVGGGKPMNYFCKDGENFRLYSVGWNEADDGGIIAHTTDGKEDRERGDWVWHYPALDY